VLGLELVVIIGVALVLCGVLARRWRIAPPVLLLAFGFLLGFIPALRAVSLPSEVVLLLFLPALLYWESLTTSLREIRLFLRVIILLSTVLVIATAGAVAAVGHQFGLPWAAAWVLGAAVAPTDATAVAVLARALPRRQVTVLRAESLVNDGTALVIFGLAVGITVGEEHLSPAHVSWLFLVAYAGGALAGAAVGWLSTAVRRRTDDRLLGNTLSVLTPFAAFLLAETIHASGVLAVVVAGLWLSQVGPRIIRAETRQQIEAFWSLTTFLLNGALFVLIGLEVQDAIRGQDGKAFSKGLMAVAAVSATVIAVRFLWMFTTPYIIRALDRRPRQRTLRSSARSRVVSSLSGFRGAVSLAAALAVPQTVASGEPFPGRDLIIFVTAGVIVVTLAQALLLPGVLRWAHFPEDTSVAQERHAAEITATEEALAAMGELGDRLDIDPKVVDRLRQEYEKHLRVLHAGDEDSADEAARTFDRQNTELRLAVLANKRATVVRLRDEGSIDDIVLRHIQTRLDIEEVRLTRLEAIE
jgi:CPA1 family monovalent cation:H+ antiporter